MERHELRELQNITSISNIPSIMKHGIVSHRRAAELPHRSVALADIQETRDRVRIPGGRMLHEYANLYFHARNPMLRRRLDQHRSLVVLRISPDVIDIHGVVIADQNAASKYVRFAAAPGGLRIVDHELVYATWWTDPDRATQWRKSSIKGAELLVPDAVPSHLILGGYVSCRESLEACQVHDTGLEFRIDSDFFFGVR
jgi:hypothetical protein